MLPTLFLPPQRPLLPEEWRHGIQALEAAMRALPGHVEGSGDHCPLTHRFADGIYVREMFLAKGTMLTGRIHRFTHPTFLMAGKLLVISEFDGRQVVAAPALWIAPQGTKRALYALEHSRLVTVHATATTDVDALEEELTCVDYEQLGAGSHHADAAGEFESLS